MKNTSKLPKDSQSKTLARALRKNATAQENHLWYDFLKSYPLPFRRQYVIEKYIVDFFCAKAKLVIEIDGAQHYTPAMLRYDAVRTQQLEKYGFRVLRFTNDEISQHLISLNSNWQKAFDCLNKEEVTHIDLTPVGTYIGRRIVKKVTKDDTLPLAEFYK